jgi:hypothetical protein
MMRSLAFVLLALVLTGTALAQTQLPILMRDDAARATVRSAATLSRSGRLEDMTVGNMEELLLTPRSQPFTTTATPAGSVFMTDSLPCCGLTSDVVHYFDGSDWLPVGSGSGGGTQVVIRDTFSPTLGQTVFTLSETPSLGDSLIFAVVNGGVYHYTDSFTVSGTSLTWLDTPMSLGPPDDLVLYYQTGTTPLPGFMQTDTFVATPGQTVFILSFSPPVGGWTFVDVNGVLYLEAANFNIAGTTLTWTDVPSPLPGGAVLTVRYQR